jgi:histidinol-phosphate aminotransferase
MTAPTYSPPSFDRAVALDLSRNEGPPAPPGLGRTLAAAAELMRRYPDTTALRRRIAELRGVPVDRVLVTAGADDALLRCFLARLGPGRSAVATTPTFQMIAAYAGQVGGRLVEVPWWDGGFPVERFVSAARRAAAAFVVSPNNPTGSVATADDLRAIADAAPFVVLDAAYAEFADEDLTPTALTLDNVLVARTLSKAYGLAGLRVGYLLGPSELIGEIAAYGSPYAVSSLSAALALERLERAGDVPTRITAVREGRAAIAHLLASLGIPSVPSQGNFVLADVGDAASVTERLAALGVGVRRFPGSRELEGSIRVTVPSDPADLEQLTTALGAVLTDDAASRGCGT